MVKKVYLHENTRDFAYLQKLQSNGMTDILPNYLTAKYLYITSPQYLMKVIAAKQSKVFKLQQQINLRLILV